MDNGMLLVSPAPHVRSKTNTQSIMLDVFDNEKGLCNFFCNSPVFLLLNGISANIVGSITTGSIIAGGFV